MAYFETAYVDLVILNVFMNALALIEKSMNFYFSIVNVSIAQIFRGLNGTGTDKHEESTDRGIVDDCAIYGECWSRFC
ncbi:hypothetical protein [Shewanella decolorationis]|uniref:Uncharacterized protein n=2 Tax=Shewanella decolorationis TaxID=256839 RepID=A0A8A7QSQ2_9GAMM|nr:hypothetical protein [Shewanella decolorationis]ESE41833.1 hypothetical protein SHD_1543 [Shewanella decolorationis S12]QTM65128.2 hypothetical protein D0436_24030 [Shewanella decolorationis]GLR34245.1 hypothetical protein GCM10007922_38040 [Shewanella decolorationis]